MDPNPMRKKTTAELADLLRKVCSTFDMGDRADICQAAAERLDKVARLEDQEVSTVLLSVLRAAELEAGASAAAEDARRRLRDRFQIKHPTFTPPGWAGRLVWERWLTANLQLHGLNGFFEQGLDRHAGPVADQIPRGSTPTSEGTRRWIDPMGRLWVEHDRRGHAMGDRVDLRTLDGTVREIDFTASLLDRGWRLQ